MDILLNILGFISVPVFIVIVFVVFSLMIKQFYVLGIKELMGKIIGVLFTVLMLFVIGVLVGIIPLSIFGVDSQPSIYIDENGMPNCSPDYMGGCN